MEIIKEIKYIAMEIHGGYHQELLPLMNEIGFNFQRVTRGEYMSKAIAFSLKHPVEASRIYKLFKNGEEWPGMSKIMGDIEISISNGLVVGIFKNRTKLSL